MPHYISLMGLLLAGVFAFWFFSYDPYLQFGVGVALSCAYVTWGTVHHILHGNFHLSVLVEYLAVALLGLVIISSLLFRV